MYNSQNTVVSVASPSLSSNETKLDKPANLAYSNTNGYGMNPDGSMNYQFSNEFTTGAQFQQNTFDYPNYLNSLQVNSVVANGNNSNNTIVS